MLVIDRPAHFPDSLMLDQNSKLMLLVLSVVDKAKVAQAA